jgi:hypothetical protein
MQVLLPYILVLYWSHLQHCLVIYPNAQVYEHMDKTQLDWWEHSQPRLQIMKQLTPSVSK